MTIPTPEPDQQQRPAQTATFAATNRALSRGAGIGVLAGLALDAVVVLVAAVGFDAPALWGALIGTGLALIITVPTLITARFATRGDFGTLAGSVLGAWLLKMIVLVGVLILVRGMDGVNLRWVGIALLAGAVVGVLAEISVLMRHRPRLNV